MRIFYFIMIVTFFVSCKKKDSTSANTVTNSTSATTGGNNTNNGSGTTTYDALFEIVAGSVKFNGTFSTPSSICRAFLCAQSVTNEVSYNYVDMGSVSLNNKVFSKNQFGMLYYYTDSTYTNFSAPFIWEASGSGNFSAATFTNSTPFPVFNDHHNLPDSISKSLGFTISLSGLNNCDFVKVFLSGPTGSSYLSPKITGGNSSSLTFTSSELTTINTGTNGSLQVQFLKDNVQIVNGKKVNVRSGRSYIITNMKVY